MLDRITIRVQDTVAAGAFYDTVLSVLGTAATDTADGVVAWGDFAVRQASDEHPATRGLHVGFAASTHERVDAFWRAGVEAGHRDDGPPGPRPAYAPDYYGGFLLDPDGNSAEAAYHGNVRREGAIDHVWLRVSDLDAARQFYEPVASHAGLRVAAELPDRVRFAGMGPSFSIVSGRPSEHVELAFSARGHALLFDPDGNAVELVNRHA